MGSDSAISAPEIQSPCRSITRDAAGQFPCNVTSAPSRRTASVTSSSLPRSAHQVGLILERAVG